eukprot:sb/3467400/
MELEFNEYIPWKWEEIPLQIKTDSVIGSKHRITIDMGRDYVEIEGITIKFSSPMKFWMAYCSTQSGSDGNVVFTDLPVQPPVEVNKIWTFTKTGSALIVTCNGVDVLNYKFASSKYSNCVPKWGGNTTDYIYFLESWNRASDFYRADDTWKVLEFDKDIPWRWEDIPIQIKTDSVVGSGDEISIDMTRAGEEVYGIAVEFSSPIKFWLPSCNSEKYPGYENFPVQPPDEVDKIWTFTKTDLALIVTCNGVEVLNYEFKTSEFSDCVSKWGGNTTESIYFALTWNTASDFYRAGKIRLL